MTTEVRTARVYLKEADHGKRDTLLKEVLDLLRDQHRVAGFTVFRGIIGSGDSGEIHDAQNLLRLNVDLPLVIEFFDRSEAVAAAIGEISKLIPGNHIVSWTTALD